MDEAARRQEGSPRRSKKAAGEVKNKKARIFSGGGERLVREVKRSSLVRMDRPKLYSDLAIETALTLRLLFKGPLRQMKGFLKSIFI